MIRVLRHVISSKLFDASLFFDNSLRVSFPEELSQNTKNVRHDFLTNVRRYFDS